jgi:aryl-alcohol dehydrogenase-like predicted oxidoreductase
VSVDTATLADDQVVPRIITGAWQLSTGHQTPRSREEVFESLSRAVDAGINAFDCGDIYTGVEELLGDFLKEYRDRGGSVAAGRVKIHTKLVPDLDSLATLDKSYVERIVDRSLRRLGIEQLDLVQLAWWSYDIERWVEVAGWLDDLRTAGKISQVGVTNFDVESLKAIVDAGVPIRSHQIQYSALDHRPEGGMVEYCQANGIGIFCYGTLAGGFLSDRHLGASDPGADPGNRSLVKYRLIIDEYGGWEAYQALLAEMKRIAHSHSATVAQIALRYVLDRPGVTSAIVGVSGAERVAEACGVFDLALGDDDREAIHDLGMRAPGPKGSVYGLERVKDGRHAAIMRYSLNRKT